MNLPKKTFASKLPSGQVESNFDNNARKISTKSQISSPCPKMKNFQILETKFFSSRCSFVHLDSKFDNTLKTFCQLNKKFHSPNSRKNTGKELFQIISFSLSCSYEHVDNRFYNMPVERMEGSQKRFISVLEVVEQTMNIKNYSKCSSGHLKCNIEKLAENLMPESRKNCSMSKKYENNMIFSIEIAFITFFCEHADCSKENLTIFYVGLPKTFL